MIEVYKINKTNTIENDPGHRDGETRWRESWAMPHRCTGASSAKIKGHSRGPRAPKETSSTKRQEEDQWGRSRAVKREGGMRKLRSSEP